METPTVPTGREHREVFSVMNEGGRLTSGWPYPDYYREIEFTDIGKALEALESFYSPIESNTVGGLGLLPTPPIARQVQRAAMKRTAE